MGKPADIAPVLTVASSREWASRTFAGKIVMADAGAALPPDYLETLSTFDGLLVADSELVSDRCVRLLLVDSDPAPRPMTPFQFARAVHAFAKDAYNALPNDMELASPDDHSHCEATYIATVTNLDTAPVANLSEFAAAFLESFDYGRSLPNDDLMAKLVADAQRLIGEGA